MNFKRTFIGDKAFYKRTLVIVLPIIIQNTVSNVVNFLDNVMVGQVGTLQMSAVAIVNQLLFVFNLCIFGGLAGPGIFSTQYVGAGDTEGVRNCFRLKLWLAGIMTVVSFVIFTVCPEFLIGKYLEESGEAAVLVMGYAKEYLHVMLWQLLPFAVSCSYAMTLRENGQTTIPMISSVAAIFINLGLNWVLIFGHFGLPALGVRGAAIATVISRFVELLILVVVTHAMKRRFNFVEHLYSTMKVPGDIIKKVAIKGFPLLLNEFLWSSGIAAIVACYSSRGIEAVAACNIATTINNLFNVVFLSMGNAVSIMLGQALGANDNEEAMGLAWKLMATTVMSSIVMGAIMFILAPAIPQMYNTEENVRELASKLLMILAVMMPFFSIPHCSYFTLRAGGKTWITFAFDCAFTWLIAYSCAKILCTFTVWPIAVVYAIVQSMDILKGIVGIALVKKGVWIQNIVE